MEAGGGLKWVRLPSSPAMAQRGQQSALYRRRDHPANNNHEVAAKLNWKGHHDDATEFRKLMWNH